jgi:hypothetical protein
MRIFVNGNDNGDGFFTTDSTDSTDVTTTTTTTTTALTTRLRRWPLPLTWNLETCLPQAGSLLAAGYSPLPFAVTSVLSVLSVVNAVAVTKSLAVYPCSSVANAVGRFRAER